MRRFGYTLVLVLFWSVPISSPAAVAASAPALPLLAQADEPPQTQPPTTPERIEEELPGESVMHEGTRFVFGLVILLIALTVLLLLIWAFRTGRRNPPVGRGKRGPSGD